MLWSAVTDVIAFLVDEGDDDGGGGGGAPPGSPPTQKFDGPWFSTQMILSLVIGVTSFLVFCVLRTKWEVVYMGRTKLKDFSPTPAHTPDAHQGKLFGWIIPTLRTSEFTVLQTVGLDAAVLLNFYKMSFLLFSLSAILATVVLMPLNLFRHGSTDSDYDPPTNDTNTDDLYAYGRYFLDGEYTGNTTLPAAPSNQTQPVSSPSTYDYLLDPKLSNTINMLFVYLFTGLTLLFLHRNCHRFIQSRQSFALHLIHSISARTVLVENVPDHLRGDRALADYFENCGWPVESVNVCRQVEKLRRVLEKRTNALLALEDAWVEWVGNPAKVKGHDPNVYGDLGRGKGKKKKDSQIVASPKPVEGVLIPDLDTDTSGQEPSTDTTTRQESSTSTLTAPENAQGGSREEIEPVIQNGGDTDIEVCRSASHLHVHTTRPRPVHRPRWFGNTVDSIEFWEKEFTKADQEVRELRQKGRFGATQVAFVTFEDVKDAQTACQVVHYPHHSEVMTTPAPEPRDVVWSMVANSKREGQIRSLVIMGVMALLILSWIPPVTTLATLLSYQEIKKVLPWLARLIDKSPRIEAIVQNSLPSVAIITFNGLLPFLLGWLSYHQGWKSRSAIEYSLLRKYHLFLLITVLFIFLLTSTFWALVRDLADSPGKIPEKLAHALLESNAKPFMISYVMLQSMGLMPSQLLTLGPLFTLGWSRLTKGKTPRDYAEANAPPMLNYGWVYPQALLIFTITLVFSVVMPLILVFGALYFGVAYLVYKYKLLFIYFKPYESNGEAWPITLHRLTWALIIFQIFMAGLFTLQKPYWLSVAILPLILFTLWWSWTNDRDFRGLSEYVALSSICDVQRGEEAEAVVGLPEEGPVTRSQANLNHRRYAMNDETLYVAPSDKRTDYSQPPMNNFYYGVLNTGRRRYAHPALTGSLPFPWLPARARPRAFGDGAAERRGVVLSLRRKMAKRLRKSQSASGAFNDEPNAEGDEAGDRRSEDIPEGWTTGESLSRAQSGPSKRAPDTDTSTFDAGDEDESGAAEGYDVENTGSKSMGSSMSSTADPWRDPPSTSGAGGSRADKLKKRMSFDPGSGVIALPDDNVWGDEEGSESENEEEHGNEGNKGNDGLPESPSTYFPHPERIRKISGLTAGNLSRSSSRATQGRK